MTYYTVGWNMPGYLPEMEPYSCEDVATAAAAMLDDLQLHADQEAQLDPPSDELAAIEEAIDNLNESTREIIEVDGWSYTTDQLHYWIDVQPGPMPEEEE